MFAIQAAVVATRFAHNIGYSCSVTNLLNSVIGIAQSIGLHCISPKPRHHDFSTPTQSRNMWHESIEVETGRRTWWQVVIQDHFAIPFTGSYCNRNLQPCNFSKADSNAVVHHLQYSTPLPLNCDDDDLVPHDDNTITTSSYTRCVAKECLLMPRLLDGIVSSASSPSLLDQYSLLLRVDQEMRDTISSFPTALLNHSYTAASADLNNMRWLPTARRTLAISAADKIIMIHRPLMYRALRTPDLPKTRRICLAAALRILREHERDAIEDRETLSIWTQTAFCTSAVTVLGLELLCGPIHKSPHAAEYRQLLSNTAFRLKQRRLDTMASRCVNLIDVYLAADAEVRSGLSTASRRPPPQKHMEYVDELVQSQKIITDFLSLTKSAELLDSTNTAGDIAPLPGNSNVPFISVDDADDFESWYNSLFAFDNTLERDKSQ